MSAPSIEKITTTTRIDLLLKELSKKRVGITVSIQGSPGVYTSTLLQIDVESRTLAFDELIPAEGNSLLKPQVRINIEGQVRNVLARFASEILEVVDDSGLPYYTAAVPELVEYAQQRKNYRVYISLSNTMDIVMHTESGAEIQGRIVNLSMGGAGFSTTKDLSLEAGDCFEDCSIELFSGSTITCKAIVHYYHYSSQSGDWRGGLEFIELKSSEEQALRACIMEVERLALRVRPEN